MSQITLEEYKLQRKYREQKRKQFLNQFEKLKHNLCAQPSQSASQIVHHSQQSQPQPVNAANNEESQLQKENTRLRNQIGQIEKQEKQKIQKFKQQMQSAKNIYFTKIKQLREIELQSKNQTQTKITKLEQQIKTATSKNDEINNFNQVVENECNKADSLMSKYAEEIKKQYDDKLEEFNKVYENSSEKIQAMEEQYNEEQFVDSTLKNQGLINSMKENVEKADQDIDKIIQDYEELLKGKSQILVQLRQNNEMKQNEIIKMSSLEQKLKTICEKLQEEKKIYLDQNKRMAEQLLEIKELLTKVMAGQS